MWTAPARWRHACSLRRHAPHDSAARDCTSEHKENYFDSRLMSDIAMFHQSSDDNRNPERNLQFDEHLKRGVWHFDSGSIAIRAIPAEHIYLQGFLEFKQIVLVRLQF